MNSAAIDFTSPGHPSHRRLSREIDEQLYAKYGLADPEQKFIESMIKPME